MDLSATSERKLPPYATPTLFSDTFFVLTVVMSGNPEVTLQPDSLYIATNQIFGSAGKYHWAFYLTNSLGECFTR